MFSPFLKFSDSEERAEFQLECTLVDIRRVFVYVSIIAAFELFLLLYDAVRQNEAYSAVQWAYVILNSVMAFFSLLQVLLTAWCSKNPQKRYKVFRPFFSIYAVIILICAIFDAVTGTVSSGRENLTMFFICLMLVSCVFYVNSFVVFFSTLILFFSFEAFTHFTTYSSHHTYAPYPVFIIFITVSVSFIRRFQMLELLRRNEIIHKLKDQALLESQLKSEFLATMSHEIRTPMNAIVGMSELALDFNLSAREKNTIRQIRSAGINLVGIINDILDFSKIESGKMEIIPEDYDLVKLMNDIANVCLVRIQDKPVGFFLEIEENLSALYHGDDMRIRQIIINLAGNSAKFTEKGFVKIRIEDLKKYESREGLRISVIDSGVGIREEDLKKLFGAFQQVDMKMNRKKGGTGLGLSISKKLVSLMDGSIGVTSEYGKGSCFFINLPQKALGNESCSQKYASLFAAAGRDEKNPSLAVIPVVSLLNKPEFAGLFVEKSESISFKAPKARLLAVDDNEVNLQIADGLLRKFGSLPVLSSSGYDCLERLQKGEDFDIIFMDHQMPGMDGIETLEKIRQLEKASSVHHVVIALSANAVSGAREMFLSKGFDDFISKPVQGKDFASALSKWLPSEFLEDADEKTSSALEIPKGFPSWDGEALNLIDAAEKCGGFENYMRTAKTFYLSIEKNTAEIGRFLLENDFKNYTILVHALKSASRIIGAEELSKKAEALENEGKLIQLELEKKKPGDLQKKILEIHERSSDMLALYTSYMKQLRPLVDFYEENESKGENQKAYDSEKVLELVKKIRAGAEDYDLDSVENLLKELKGFTFDDKKKELISLMEKAVEEIEYSQIEALCLDFEKEASA